MATTDITIQSMHVFVHCGPGADAMQIIHAQLETIMATLAEATAELGALKDQVTKVGAETQTLIAKIAELTAIIDAGGAGNTTPEFDAALAALKAQVEVVDSLVPDAP